MIENEKVYRISRYVAIKKTFPICRRRNGQWVCEKDESDREIVYTNGQDAT